MDTVLELLIFQTTPYQLKVTIHTTQTHVATEKIAAKDTLMDHTGTTSTTLAVFKDQQSITITQDLMMITHTQPQVTMPSTVVKRDTAISSTETITEITHQMIKVSHSVETSYITIVKTTATITAAPHTITTAQVRVVSMKTTHAVITPVTSTVKLKDINATQKVNAAHTNTNGAINQRNVFQKTSHAVMKLMRTLAHGTVTTNATPRDITAAHTPINQMTQVLTGRDGAQMTGVSMNQLQEITVQTEDADTTDTVATKREENSGVIPSKTAENQSTAAHTDTKSTVNTKRDVSQKKKSAAPTDGNNAHNTISGMKVKTTNSQVALNTVAHHQLHGALFTEIAETKLHAAHNTNQSVILLMVTTLARPPSNAATNTGVRKPKPVLTQNTSAVLDKLISMMIQLTDGMMATVAQLT